MPQYYIHDGQNEKGPLDLEQLKLETLNKETPIWFDGLENWTTIGEVQELKDLFKATPPPLKKPELKNSTPPKIKQETYADTSIDNSKSTKKKSLLVPIIIGSVVVIVGIFGLVAYQNSTNASTLETIQKKVATQEQVLEIQQSEDASKEAERQRINIANTEKNKKYRNYWSEYISVTNNRYSYREIGGIFGLEVVVTNNTEYLLDEVEVQVGYVKDNGDNFKSETVRVYNIPANSSKSQTAPDSERGKSVEMTINGITSKKMHFCYEPGNWANNSEDPYFCK